MILSFGSINVDLSARVERLPRAGETILATSLQTALGGKGANQAVAAARAGGNSVLLGAVGADSFGGYAQEQLTSYGVDISKVECTLKHSTGVAWIHVDAQAENSITVVAGANSQAKARSAEPVLDATGVLLLQLEVPLEQVQLVAQSARAHGVLTILDPAPARSLPTELLSSVDILTPNETEAATLLGRSAPAAEMAQDLLALGVEQVIVKCSSRGLAYAGKDGEGELPAFEVQAIDSVAAGDAFNGALAVALAEKQPWLQALRFAAAAGALATTRGGAAAAMPERAEIEELLAQHQG